RAVDSDRLLRGLPVPVLPDPDPGPVRTVRLHRADRTGARRTRGLHRAGPGRDRLTKPAGRAVTVDFPAIIDVNHTAGGALSAVHRATHRSGAAVVRSRGAPTTGPCPCRGALRAPGRSDQPVPGVGCRSDRTSSAHAGRPR